MASVPLVWLADLCADAKALNPNGGAIALGHPGGGSGARLMTTLVQHMRDNGIRYGLQTMCEGGGQASATILELLRGRPAPAARKRMWRPPAEEPRGRCSCVVTLGRRHDR